MYLKKLVVALTIAAVVIAMTSVAYAKPQNDRYTGLQKMVFIHYKKSAKPPWAGGKNSVKECYDLLNRGAKWKTTVTYYIDPDNDDGLNESFVASAIHSAAEEWDRYTSVELFNDSYKVIYDATWDSDSPDGKNEILFGYYSDPNVIAVTVVWGRFVGPPSEREIIEFDVLFNDYYPWGDADYSSGVMDLQNIATHELGHGIGLDDLYDSSCYLETMYGYSDYDETYKRSLNDGDIAGLHELYGP